MAFNLVFFTFALHLTFFVQTVFPLDYEKETRIWGNPSDENIVTSTAIGGIQFVTKSASHYTLTSTQEKSLSVTIENYDPNEICSGSIKCGFQLYDAVTRKPNYPFIKYCTCAEGLQCLPDGENMRQRFFYYRCKKELEVKKALNLPPSCRTKEETPSDTRSFEEWMESVENTPPVEDETAFGIGENLNTHRDVVYPTLTQPRSEGDQPSVTQFRSEIYYSPVEQVSSKNVYFTLDNTISKDEL